MMPRMDPFDPIRFRLWRPAWWQLALLAAVGVAIVVAVAIVATSLVLIIAPVVLVAVLAQRFLARRSARRGDVYPGARYEAIDAEYEVISTRPADRSPPEGGGGGRKRDE